MITLKNILKGIFPRAFLKQAFLVYNQTKAKTWDRLFFRKEKIRREDYLFHEEKNPFADAQIDISRFDQTIQDKLSLWTDVCWRQDQYLLYYRNPGFIEPKVGWGVSLTRNLIYPSLGFASAAYVHKPDFFETYFKKKQVTRIKKVISIRDTGEENYFHFFNDVLAKLFFLVEQNVKLEDYTLIVGRELYKKPYFEYFLNQPFFKNLTWHVQEPHEWIKFEVAIFCKPFTHTKRFLDKVNELTDRTEHVREERRIFLTRSPTSLRFIENISEVESVLARYEFETIDTSQMSFESQIQLFRGCRYLVAIHGAGISNIIFRSGSPLSLLEIIHASTYIPFHYILMCKMYGYRYEALLGKKGSRGGTGGFVVDTKELEIRISRLLADS